MSNQETGLFSCRNTCWIIGALLGVAVYLVLGCGIVALIVAAIVGVGAAFLLQKIFCGEVAEASTTSRAPASIASKAASAAASSSSTATASTSASDDAAATVSASVMDSAAMNTASSAVPVAAAAPEVIKEAPKKAAPKKAAAKKTPAAKAPAAKSASAKKPAAKKAKVDKAKADTVKTEAATPTGKPKKPRTMKAPRKAGADDLKQLKGVGPKLEQTLNDLGFWHFDQVAKWGADEISWVDDNLKFKGRIERDGWVDQAKILAEGGETAFSNKVKKGKVY